MPRRDLSDRHKLGRQHVWNRAKEGRALFRSDADRDFFTDLVASRVSRSNYSSPAHRRASRVSGIDVLAMCLMTTHFHLVLFQHAPDAMRRFMQSVLTGYGRYYRNKYGTSGALYNGPFRSRYLKNDKEARWAIGYVHDNHPSGATYRYSTHTAYLDDHQRPGWLAVQIGLDSFDDVHHYVRHMRDRATRAELNSDFF